MGWLNQPFWRSPRFIQSEPWRAPKRLIQCFNTVAALVGLTVVLNFASWCLNVFRFLSLTPFLLIVVAAVFSGGCDSDRGQSKDKNVLRLATTTSTRDSGLLDRLVPPFERAQQCRVDVIAVGTGAALKLGEDGDADALVVHAEAAEQAFMEAGHGVRRESFMFNHFVILGPNENPAKIDESSVINAFRRIADTKSVFVSRGDDSGTHKRELSLWEAAGGRPEDWDGYFETGQGMGASLRIADEKRGYVLADYGTFLKLREKFDLVPLSVSSARLKNVYSVITVDPTKNSQIHGALANSWVDFLISAEAQQIINSYEQLGHRLFQGSR